MAIYLRFNNEFVPQITKGNKVIFQDENYRYRSGCFLLRGSNDNIMICSHHNYSESSTVFYLDYYRGERLNFIIEVKYLTLIGDMIDRTADGRWVYFLDGPFSKNLYRIDTTEKTIKIFPLTSDLICTLKLKVSRDGKYLAIVISRGIVIYDHDGNKVCFKLTMTNNNFVDFYHRDSDYLVSGTDFTTEIDKISDKLDQSKKLPYNFKSLEFYDDFIKIESNKILRIINNDISFKCVNEVMEPCSHLDVPRLEKEQFQMLLDSQTTGVYSLLIKAYLLFDAKLIDRDIVIAIAVASYPQYPEKNIYFLLDYIIHRKIKNLDIYRWTIEINRLLK